MGDRPAAKNSTGTGEEVTTESTQYAATSSAYGFLKRAWERFGKEAGDVGSLTVADQAEYHEVPVLSYGDRFVRHSPRSDGSELLSKEFSSELLSTYFDFAMPTYRFLHRQAIEKWHEDLYNSSAALLPVRKALVLLVLATALLFRGTNSADDSRSRDDSEDLYRTARRALAQESGKPRLESVQSRFAACLYLLHTSRPNEAWYLFGTTVQIAFAQGLHQGRTWTSGQAIPDLVVRECRKRTFWAMSTLDVYLSVILGRPTLIHDADCDHLFPASLDDDELLYSPSFDTTAEKKDRVILASVLHAKIAHVVRSAARDQAAVARKPDDRKIEAATRSNDAVTSWYDSLPVILSGAVHPSSLVPVYRRQITVLGLAHAHALMLINRPMLLLESTRPLLFARSHIETCLTAANTALDLLLALESTERNDSLAAFWFSSFVAFNAVSIVYVWAIQRARGRLADMQAPSAGRALLDKAEIMQSRFGCSRSAPSLRYHAVLRELQEELRRQPLRPETRLPPDQASNAMVEQSMGNSAEAQAHDMDDWGFPSADDPLDPDLWLQLDSFPFGECLSVSKKLNSGIDCIS